MATSSPSFSRSKAALAGRAWRLMFDYLMATSPRRERSLASRGLTPNDARALHSLDADEGRPIGTLAREWKCDPSNATWIVDRLEKSGLVERRPAPSDRRVKMVALTPLGASTMAALLEEFHEPPPELFCLERVDLENLERVLRKLTGTSPGTHPHGAPSRQPGK